MRAIILLWLDFMAPLLDRRGDGLIDCFEETISGKLVPEKALLAAQHRPLSLLKSMVTVPGQADGAGGGHTGHCLCPEPMKWSQLQCRNSINLGPSPLQFLIYWPAVFQYRSQLP